MPLSALLEGEFFNTYIKSGETSLRFPLAVQSSHSGTWPLPLAALSPFELNVLCCNLCA